MQKVIAIVGATCSGKTGLAVALALALDGEVISADSRQVYRGLDIGTGKVTSEEMQGIPHHLLDIANPRERYTVAHYRTDALRAIKDIIARGKLPIIAGGTGLYVDALLYEQTIPDVPPNEELRATLATQQTNTLFEELVQKDPVRAVTIDKHNKRRVIRALEIIATLGAVPIPHKAPARFDHLLVGLSVPKEKLALKIHNRLIARLNAGMLDEAKRLHAEGLEWNRFNELGLEYRCMRRHITGELTYEQMVQKLEQEIVRYTRRQNLWWKNRTDINWCHAPYLPCAQKLIKEHLKV